MWHQAFLPGWPGTFSVSQRRAWPAASCTFAETYPPNEGNILSDFSRYPCWHYGQGLFIGEWALDDRTVYVTNLSDASDASKLPVPTTFPSASTSTATSHANPNATSYATRYVFQMTLNLQSRPLGKWNKLEFSGYDSIDLGSGETIPLSLKHERPYHFSKVRSYAV